MAIRCGFFNSVNNDRKYDAKDMGRLFEGVISDGVFSNFGNTFEVTPVEGTMEVVVNTGKGWFYEKYFEIIDPEPVTIPTTAINSRIDAICIKIDDTNSVRAGSIVRIAGQEGETPLRPSIPTESGVNYIPIALITINNNVNVSTGLIIRNNVGNRTDVDPSYRCPWSEPTLDPRRAMYIYDGTVSGEDPALNELVVLDIDTIIPQDAALNTDLNYTVNYPNRFDKDTSYVTSVLYHMNNSTRWLNIGDAIGTGPNYIDYFRVYLEDNNIKLTYHIFDTRARNTQLKCKILISKVVTE